MKDLEDYNTDGACAQARAVLAYLQDRGDGGVESTWDGSQYLLKPKVSRWENCREQGYVVVLRSFGEKSKQLNIIFFEHRNSDSICAVKWLQETINAPTIDTADFGDVYQDKYDVCNRLAYGQASEMADWIWEQLDAFGEEFMKEREEYFNNV